MTMTSYKALMLDLDGTTIPNALKAVPSKRVITAIHNAQQKIAVCVVTGRSLQEAAPILDILQITKPTVLMGGSQIVDGISQKVIYKKPLAKNDIQEIINLLSQYPIDISIREATKTKSYRQGYPFIETYGITAMNIPMALADELTNKISHLPNVTAHKVLSWTHKEYVLLNISHVNATKQYAIFEVAKLLGVATHEIIGIGDGHNDFPLLMACGLKVAIGNAVPELKAIADYIAPSVDDDGVAAVIDKFIM